MARPRKKGLSYFPFDVDFFSGRKIKVLRSKIGNDGVLLYLYILCEIYKDEGYFLKLDEDLEEFICSELEITSEKFKAILEFTLKKGIFDKHLFEQNRVLTSANIQEVYQKAKENAGRKLAITVEKEIWLLNEEKTLDFIRVLPVKENDFTKVNVSASEIQCTPMENSACIYPQSKVNKNKLNKRKVDEKQKKLLEFVKNSFATVADNYIETILSFLDLGVSHNLIKYAVLEAVRKDKPYEYMTAILNRRVAENKLDISDNKKSKTSYDLDEFEKLGFKIPKE